ncbi:MAG: integral rane sensor hybrid histidine kinase [Rariglobus sp.]|jgi:signal transduction histidine kinase/CheY-like chemotaxis protein|nr:integral rane sensor hybrid histidine kinase [Rariglobus sp.]
MLRPFATYLDTLDLAYRDRPYFVGLKARLMAWFSGLILVLVPLNMAKLLWIHPPLLGFRISFTLFMGVGAAFCLHWAKKGRADVAGNGLVLVTTLSVHMLMLLVPAYTQPLSAAILLFAFDLLFLLLALVFASRFVAVGVLVIVVASQVTFHVRELQADVVTGSIEFAAATLLRDGLIVITLVFCLGMALVRMIEEAHRRSEESLNETRAMNENLGRLVAERTRDLEVAMERANEASRAKGDFLANMSHEIRTPLNGIIASADLLWRRPDLPPDATEHLRLIEDSGELLLKQLSDILDFSKIEAGQLELEIHRFQLAPLVADCVALMAPGAVHGGMRLDYEVASEIPHSLQGDSFRLRQVLLNLMANAIKFTPAGGHVRLVVTCEDPQGNPVPVRFEVRDTGIGMDEAAMKQIFDRFTQADSSTTRRYGGTGLGLAICSRIVGMMGGKIKVESVPGKGSAFYFTVPLRTFEAPEVIVVPKPKVVALGLRVLVAEDNAMNRKILGAQLAALGCACTMTNDGEEVLAALQQAPLPDVVLMDCHMPNLDGWEATRRLRSWAGDRDSMAHHRKAALVPVIALTAAALPEERTRCLESGMNDFLSKPVKLSDLQRTLQPFAPTAVSGN